MIGNQRQKWWICALALSFVLVGCEGTDDNEQGENNETEHNEQTENDLLFPLEDLDTLTEGAKANEELPEEAKGDEVFPAQFDLVDLQSPVSDQGRRGVCSIFSAVGLMEHLYIKSGKLDDPQFSEQYLQWSAKMEVGSFPNSSGSSARYNLQAISDYGIPTEEAWPYESSPWGAQDDPECEGDNRPTRCYTNGNPPQEAVDAPKYQLPAGRWISTRTRDIKAHIHNQGEAVVVGGDFYYQAWNHGASDLPINRDYSSEGYVLYPNDEDIERSLENRAGHSILLVGWNDDLEVERLDENGDVMVDENGDPVTEQGFFIFKNSWGTGSFGTNNPHGDGYGYISYDYVEQFKNGRVAGTPEPIHVPEPEDDEELECTEDSECTIREICSDNECVDAGYECVEDSECDLGEICASNECEELEGELETFAYEGDEQTIPDNDPDGLISEIEVEGSGLIQELSAEVWIEHTYNGDIEIELIHPEGASVTLREADGSAGWDIIEEYDVDDFIGLESEGTWQLKMVDTAHLDEGKLVDWYLYITR